VCASKGLAYDVRKYGKPVYIIPNYPDEKFKRTNKDLRKEFNIPENIKIILFLGRLSVIEGVELLPKIANSLKGLNAELWIVGDGPESQTVQKLAEKNKKVRWFKWIPHKEVANYNPCI